ncbi:hypothetical protein PGT21_036028 [Puccinia graminis f. sp. tritici]|uniref:Uncharacterized protein n=1 Tax=Puccinia graminis f. sp. tritici TaxID=56615 RepID=A0A5B0Q044_PUCGR|nr:hypothetical protein PGT21_036028 [Puccinia graminis f. sp. tritici]
MSDIIHGDSEDFSNQMQLGDDHAPTPTPPDPTMQVGRVRVKKHALGRVGSGLGSGPGQPSKNHFLFNQVHNSVNLKPTRMHSILTIPAPPTRRVKSGPGQFPILACPNPPRDPPGTRDPAGRPDPLAS